MTKYKILRRYQNESYKRNNIW